MPPTNDPLAGLSRDLTENGLAFLRRAVGEMSAQAVTFRNLSFAVVDLAAAVEVLIKARLVREHWTLICADPDKVTAALVLAGTSKTVALEQAVKRLDGVAGVPMTVSGYDKRVDEIARLRNRAIHFTTVGAPPAALQAALGRGLDLVLWFLSTEFRDQADNDTQVLVEESIEDLTTQVGHLKDLVKERMTTIAGELDEAVICVECPRCSQPTLMLIEGGVARCAFCLWKPIDGSESAEEYVSAVLGISRYDAVTSGADWPIFKCHACSEDAMVEDIKQLRPDPATLNADQSPCDWISPVYWGCFACGTAKAENEIDHCTRCGIPTVTGYDGFPICSDCFADVERD
jgi:hypothetical protein